MRPRLLDLFSCQGGAAMGYHRAGFEVVGVDIAAQPRYPFEHHVADALGFLGEHGHEFDAVHASPPCHDHSALRSVTGRDHGTGWLLEATLDALRDLGKPFVVENVESAEMPTNVLLCGSMFGLGADDNAGRRRTLRRHRRFATTVYLLCPPDSCRGRLIGGVYGGGGGQMSGGSYTFHAGPAGESMGIDWMSRDGLAQAIPPAYTEFLGAALLDQVNTIGEAA